MSSKHDPKTGNWYETTDSQSFKVIGVDEDSETIEIQHLDGGLEHIDFDAWFIMEVEPIVPPKDWEGLCDDSEDYPVNEYTSDTSVNDESWDDESMDEESEIKEY